jgi:hypothetical protein
MKIDIRFETDNAAFEDSFVDEVENVLRNSISCILDAKSRKPDDFQKYSYTLRDSNGNKVGSVAIGF